MSRSFYPTLHYHIQILNELIRRSVYYPDIQRYQVTNLIWLRCHAHLAEFRHRNDVIPAFSLCFEEMLSSFDLAVGISALLRLAKIGSMVRESQLVCHCAQFKKVSGIKI